MATINFNLERAFLKGTPVADVSRMRITKKVDPKLLNPCETSINLMINVNGKLFKISSEERILPKFWDFSNKRPKNSYPGAFELNMILDRLKNTLIKDLRNAQLSRPQMSIEEVRELIKNSVTGLLPDMRSVDLFTAYAEFLNEKSSITKPLTIKKYRTLLKTLKDFEKFKGKTLCFHHITMEFDREFKNYLIQTKGLMNNTVSKYYDTIRVYMSWAQSKAYHNNEDYKQFVTKRDDTDIIYLSACQLDAIYNLDLSKRPGHELVRNLFIFQANTGQRYSDLVNLKWTDLHTMIGGTTEWWLYQIKGNKSKKITIPLTDKAKEILYKYLPRKGVYEKVFPCYSNVVCNRYLKEIARLAGLDTPITIVQYSGKRRIETTMPLSKFVGTHTARSSFVTNSLQNGMRPEVIQQVTGHEDYKVMKRYIKITQQIVSNEMLKAWN